jgi:2-oxoglutarate ferredoxin oxidoreductase subunit delta
MANKNNRKGYRPVEIIDEARCTGCLSCARMCPDVAIEIYRE